MAIARNASAALSLQNPVSGFTYTRAYTVGAGANRILFVFFFMNSVESDTGATYAGVTMTKLSASQVGNGTDRAISGYYLIAPASGANNIVVTFSDNPQVQGYAVDYTDAHQTTPIDAQNGASDAGAASVAAAVTVTAANCWLLAFHRENSGTSDVWTNVTEIASGGGLHIADSNATVATGSITVTADPTGSPANKLIVVALKPTGGAGPSFVPAFMKPVAQAVNRASTF